MFSFKKVYDRVYQINVTSFFLFLKEKKFLLQLLKKVINKD